MSAVEWLTIASGVVLVPGLVLALVTESPRVCAVAFCVGFPLWLAAVWLFLAQTP